jgi:REP element-mobilizing transposase RayT
MDKYKNKYRISSHRRPNWDYSADALYFITIVTQNRACNLGKIVQMDGLLSEMILTDFGKIVQTEWFKSFEIRNELLLHEFILMPNHLHAIVEIVSHGVIPTQPPLPTINNTDLKIKRNPPIRLPKSISSFIAGFKSSVNTKIDDYIDKYQLGIPKYNKNNHFFQPNYHDHIIRNEFEYNNISNYIINNPSKWAKDKFNN